MPRQPRRKTVKNPPLLKVDELRTELWAIGNAFGLMAHRSHPGYPFGRRECRAVTIAFEDGYAHALTQERIKSRLSEKAKKSAKNEPTSEPTPEE